MSIALTSKLLQNYLADRVIWIDGRDYVGRAHDGEYVALGTVGEEAALQRYLEHCPTARYW